MFDNKIVHYALNLDTIMQAPFLNSFKTRQRVAALCLALDYSIKRALGKKDCLKHPKSALVLWYFSLPSMLIVGV